MRYALAVAILMLLVSNAFGEEVSFEKHNYSVTAGLGFMNGHTTYQIGGHFTTPDGSGDARFPVSELKFPLNVYFGNLGGDVSLTPRLKLKANLKKNISSDAGKTKDSDWGIFYYEIDGWTDQDSLDIYSESDTETDAVIADVSLRYSFMQRVWRKAEFSFFIGGKSIYQKFDFKTSDLDQWYPSANSLSGYDIGHDKISGKVLIYKMTEWIPAVITGMDLTASQKFSLDVMFGYAPYATAKDEDHHLLRSLTTKSDCDGDAILFSLTGDYRLLNRWGLGLSYDYTKMDTKGHEKQYQDGEYSATVDHKNFTTLQTFGVRLHYLF